VERRIGNLNPSAYLRIRLNFMLVAYASKVTPYVIVGRINVDRWAEVFCSFMLQAPGWQGMQETSKTNQTDATRGFVSFMTWSFKVSRVFWI